MNPETLARFRPSSFSARGARDGTSKSTTIPSTSNPIEEFLSALFNWNAGLKAYFDTLCTAGCDRVRLAWLLWNAARWHEAAGKVHADRTDRRKKPWRRLTPFDVSRGELATLPRDLRRISHLIRKIERSDTVRPSEALLMVLREGEPSVAFKDLGVPGIASVMADLESSLPILPQLLEIYATAVEEHSRQMTAWFGARKFRPTTHQEELLVDYVKAATRTEHFGPLATLLADSYDLLCAEEAVPQGDYDPKLSPKRLRERYRERKRAAGKGHGIPTMELTNERLGQPDVIALVNFWGIS